MCTKKIRFQDKFGICPCLVSFLVIRSFVSIVTLKCMVSYKTFAVYRRKISASIIMKITGKEIRQSISIHLFCKEGLLIDRASYAYNNITNSFCFWYIRSKGFFYLRSDPFFIRKKSIIQRDNENIDYIK